LNVLFKVLAVVLCDINKKSNHMLMKNKNLCWF